MGFSKPGLDSARIVIGQSLREISSSYNDGFIQRHCKHDLYMLKCWLEDEYSKLPTFTGEEEWEQERIIKILTNK
jgi:hypothetical protein